LKFWRDAGKRVAIVSGRSSAAVTRRAAELGIAPVHQAQADKRPAFERVLAEVGVAADEVCAVGDDLPDLPVLLRAGLAVAVADAAPEVRAAADYVTAAAGGAGAVREAIEWLMKLTGEWERVVESFRAAAR